MTIQITVRLADELVEYVDARVRDGRGASRAEIVAAALERDRRRVAAERDAAIYAAHAGEDDPDDWEGLAAYGARDPLEID